VTEKQIRDRLNALKMYEASVMFSMPDEGEYTERELLRISAVRVKLLASLKNVSGAVS
jgi:hypothetical protein